MTDHNYLPLFSLLVGAVLGTFYGVLFGMIAERRRWRDYHRTVIDGLSNVNVEFYANTTPPSAEADYLSRLEPDNETWIDEIQERLTK